MNEKANIIDALFFIIIVIVFLFYNYFHETKLRTILKIRKTMSRENHMVGGVCLLCVYINI